MNTYAIVLHLPASKLQMSLDSQQHSGREEVLMWEDGSSIYSQLGNNNKLVRSFMLSVYFWPECFRQQSKAVKGLLPIMITCIVPWCSILSHVSLHLNGFHSVSYCLMMSHGVSICLMLCHLVSLHLITSGVKVSQGVSQCFKVSHHVSQCFQEVNSLFSYFN